MELKAFETVARALEQERVRYLLAGGLAVIVHGYGRMTFDIDLVIQLEPDNIVRAFRALAGVGYQPRIPVTADQFADTKTREGWIRDKGMVVLNMWSDQFRDTPIDIFVTEPFDFDETYDQALSETLDDGTAFRFVDIPTLIGMKRLAGRGKDLDDIRHLEMLLDEDGLDDSRG
jgi:hypothetical protein